MSNVCTTKDDLIIVRLRNDLDHHVTEQIRDEIDNTIMQTKIFRLAFDFRNVNFMDSSGIGLLMGRYKKIKPVGGEIFVSNLNLQMRRIFNIFGLRKITSENRQIDRIVNEEDTYEQSKINF